MHRSGTSALTRVINLLGADLSKNLMAGHADNPTGHWESNDLYVIHDEMLAVAGSNWRDWRKFSPVWFNSPLSRPFKARILEVLKNDFPRSRLWLVKDPRICRFWPLWRDVLEEFGAKPFVVIPVRNPLEVAASLKQRDGITPAHTYLLWLRHVLDAESSTRDLPRAIISYEAMIEDWQTSIAVASRHIGLSWPRRGAFGNDEIEQFLSTHHRHQRIAPEKLVKNPEVAEWVREVYAVLGRMVKNPSQPSDLRRLDRIRADFDRASEIFGTVLAANELEVEKLAHEVIRVRDESAAELVDRERERDKAREQLRESQSQVQRLAGEAAEASGRAVRLDSELRAIQAAQEQEKKQVLILKDQLVDAETALAKYKREAQASQRERLFALVQWRKVVRLLLRSGLFDSEWYAARYPDVAKSGRSPVEHYLTEGYLLGFQPNPFFDSRWYLQRYEDVRRAGLNPLIHYVEHGHREGRNPSPHFDTIYYLDANPDIRDKGINPLEHYLRYGRHEGRFPTRP